MVNVMDRWLFGYTNLTAVTKFEYYRIYSRISRGFLDKFLIKNWVGRGIRFKNYPATVSFLIKFRSKAYLLLVDKMFFEINCPAQ